MEENELAWIAGSLQLVGEAKPSPNTASQCSFAADGNEHAFWNKLVELNQRQAAGGELVESKGSSYEKEDEFVRLILTIEGDKLSKELFSLLFDLVSGWELGNGWMLWFIDNEWWEYIVD